MMMTLLLCAHCMVNCYGIVNCYCIVNSYIRAYICPQRRGSSGLKVSCRLCQSFVLYRCTMYYNISYHIIFLCHITPYYPGRARPEATRAACRPFSYEMKRPFIHESVMSLRIIAAAHHAMPSGPGGEAARIVCHYICIIWAICNIHYYICIIIVFLLYIVIFPSFGSGTISESTLLPPP